MPTFYDYRKPYFCSWKMIIKFQNIYWPEFLHQWSVAMGNHLGSSVVTTWHKPCWCRGLFIWLFSWLFTLLVQMLVHLIVHMIGQLIVQLIVRLIVHAACSDSCHMIVQMIVQFRLWCETSRGGSDHFWTSVAPERVFRTVNNPQDTDTSI